MARDIYQIGIDAVKVLEEQENEIKKLNELDEIWTLRNYKSNIDPGLYSELVNYNDPSTLETELEYPCRSCGTYTYLECSPCDFDPDMIYCGKDQYCCP